MNWSAVQYARFEEERTRPARDLLSAVPNIGVGRAVDLGCGPGNSTGLLCDRFPDATIIGIDSSPAMIAAAQERLPGVTFEVADLADWRDAVPVDLFFANASLQWVPDHERLLPSLLGRLTPGGFLAIQVPDNSDEPSHRAMRALSTDEPWKDKLAGTEHLNAVRHPAVWYSDLLRPLAGKVNIWRTTYHHELPDAAAIVEWFKGSALRPLLARLDTEEQSAFLTAYQGAIAAAYPASTDGAVLLPFPRLFITAKR